MPRERTSSKEWKSWLEPSQVFANTQKVDLFDDPRWETTVTPSRRRPMPDEPRPRVRWAIGMVSAFRRVPMKRGKHSRRLV